MVRPLVLFALYLFSVPVSAQAPDPLMQMCAGFLNQPGVQIAVDAQRLCNCLVREVKAKLSAAEMAAYDRSTATGEPMPEGVQAKITGIAVQCLAEAR